MPVPADGADVSSGKWRGCAPRRTARPLGPACGSYADCTCSSSKPHRRPRKRKRLRIVIVARGMLGRCCGVVSPMHGNPTMRTRTAVVEVIAPPGSQPPAVACSGTDVFGDMVSQGHEDLGIVCSGRPNWSNPEGERLIRALQTGSEAFRHTRLSWIRRLRPDRSRTCPRD